jgi:cytosine/adenosine deaminase-related metal-dependent hydrolase
MFSSQHDEPDPETGVTFRLTAETGFHAALRAKIESRGGLFNAHLHLDRSGTLSFVEAYLRRQAVSTTSAISLQAKHGLMSVVHDSALYTSEALTSRIGEFLDAMARIGTTRIDTTVDVTEDGLGLTALQAFLDLKSTFADRLDVRVGAYNPLGFRDDEPSRWDLLLGAAESADFIAALPERDDTTRYPDHVGFDRSVRMVVELAARTGKEVHIHVDQANHQCEDASERVLDVLDDIEHDLRDAQVWFIHAISPSAYDDVRFQHLVERMVHHRVGVLVCPSAAISMRQVRAISGPTRNSIARVLDFSAAGIPVRIGSDNICDITSPAGTLDLMNEIFVLSHALRYFDVDYLAAVATGSALTDDERERVRHHLDANVLEEQRVIDFLKSQGFLRKV